MVLVLTLGSGGCGGGVLVSIVTVGFRLGTPPASWASFSVPSSGNRASVRFSSMAAPAPPPASMTVGNNSPLLLRTGADFSSNPISVTRAGKMFERKGHDDGKGHGRGRHLHDLTGVVVIRQHVGEHVPPKIRQRNRRDTGIQEGADADGRYRDAAHEGFLGHDFSSAVVVGGHHHFVVNGAHIGLTAKRQTRRREPPS